MREIKFRGKATMALSELEDMHFTQHEEGWFKGNLVMFGKTPYIVGDFIQVDEEYTINEFWIKVHPESVGQYTGLKDKNGRDIYEGDIILFGDFDYDGREFPCQGEVIFEDGCYHVTNAITESKLYNHSDEYIEVIGNVYENPELLEVK